MMLALQIQLTTRSLSAIANSVLFEIVKTLILMIFDHTSPPNYSIG